jgi:hypothetical protein
MIAPDAPHGRCRGEYMSVSDDQIGNDPFPSNCVSKKTGRNANRKDFTMFAKNQYSSSKLHIVNKDGSPSLCLECAKWILKKDKEHNSTHYSGYLNRTQSLAYAESCQIRSPHHTLMTEGLIVLDSKFSTSLKTSTNNLVQSDLITTAKLIKPRKISTLMDDNSQDSFKEYRNKHRLWANVFPSNESIRNADIGKRTSFMLKSIESFAISLQKHLFPHDHYFIIARGMAKDVISNYHPVTKPLFCVKKANLFVRFKELHRSRQTFHMDDVRIGFEIILPIICGPCGYEVCYIPKSHHLMHLSNREIKFPPNIFVSAMAKRGEIIILADSLIHAGGGSSGFGEKGMTENNRLLQGFSPSFNGTNVTHNTPTDVSFQFSMEHSGSPRASTNSEFGDGNIWFKRDRYEAADATETIEIAEKFDLYIKSGIEFGPFDQSMGEASTEFQRLASLDNGGQPMNRRFKRSKRSKDN